MLKAVRFDPEIHKELIDYIENYRDKRGKPNHSEAIRVLMEKGFEFISNTSQNTETKIVEIQQPTIDLDKFREDVLKEIWATIGKNVIIQPTQAHTFTQVNQNIPPQIEETKKEPEKPAPQPIKTTIPVTGNTLFNNLLGNANR